MVDNQPPIEAVFLIKKIKMRRNSPARVGLDEPHAKFVVSVRKSLLLYMRLLCHQGDVEGLQLLHVGLTGAAAGTLLAARCMSDMGRYGSGCFHD